MSKLRPFMLGRWENDFQSFEVFKSRIASKMIYVHCLFSRCTAHGKRSESPQREMKPVELNDRWAMFKIFPEKVVSYWHRINYPPYHHLFHRMKVYSLKIYCKQTSNHHSNILIMNCKSFWYFFALKFFKLRLSTSGKSLNFPSLDQQVVSSEELSLNQDKDSSQNVIEPETREFHQKHRQTGQRIRPFMEPFQFMRLDKSNFEQ